MVMLHLSVISYCLLLLPFSLALPRATIRCPTDIVFVVDQSTSVTKITFNTQVIPFLITMTNQLSISEKGDHIAVVPFSSPSETEVAFHLDFSFDKANITGALNDMKFSGGTTATKKALKLVRDEVFKMNKGARRLQYGKTVAPIVLIITDGMATDGDPTLEAQELRVDEVTIFAVGVGSAVSSEYLEKIAGDKLHVFSVKTFNDLSDQLIKGILASTHCESKKL